jgi:hypothetical protein
VARRGGGVYKGLVGKTEGKRPLGRLRRRWKENIKADLLFRDILLICVTVFLLRIVLFIVLVPCFFLSCKANATV